MRNPELNRLSALFAGADVGHFDLPESVTAARRLVAALESAPAPVVAVGEADALRTLTAAILAAGRDPKAKWPTAEKVADARRAEQDANTWREAHGLAVEAAAGELVASVLDDPDAIIVECLRPALGETLDLAASHVPAFHPVAGFSDRDLLSAIPEAREAVLGMDRLSARYSAIRSAQEMLSRGRCSLDVDGIFAEVRNLRELFGGMWPGRNQNTYRPWPTGARQRLAWLVSSDASVWMPTPGERDDAWRRVFGNRAAVAGMTVASAEFVGPEAA